MSRPLVVDFVKMHGAGNDFIIVDNRFFRFSDTELAMLARWWCPRRTGIGADGLLAFAPPEEEDHHYRMRYFNADGSQATMCGNGARCLARFARDAGLSEDPLVFETDAGEYRAEVPDASDSPVRLYVPPPERYQDDVELVDASDLHPAAVDYVWTGTEHAVCVVEDVETVPVDKLGRAIRRDEAFAPTGANANFVQIESAGIHPGDLPSLRVRTFEKGVEAETRACGTGALAAAVVAYLQGYTSANRIDVHMPGGTLTVGFQVGEDGRTITDLYLEGPVVRVFRGTVDVNPARLSESEVAQA